ncbi:MAG TPA: 1-(5-phosphoribosyl)-5-[(5-phosphoribosylamino)methylideneamino]imidazole-4-carboxamide isomerase [Sediminispirochaeta sp.]|nr:1-(5-phosphoribosyl)-5-[(5-phosphoribosylamino)methylideneamino]imidazole-4-carboxamide isomerase [Sediminispirochaeta sp.]
MIFIPAIDLLDGACVRLLQGDYGKSTRYEHDPVALARRFEEMGVRRLHLVDLNAARGEESNNRRIIKEIKKSISIPIELGGGIRDKEDVNELIELGVDRLIVGTVLVRDPERVARWSSRYPGRFIAGIDAKDGEVRVAGWEEGSAMSDTEAARLARELGVASIIYTNIQRDGTLQGPDIENSLMVADASGLPVIVSGGVHRESDLAEIQKASSGRIAGVISGKALYENKIDPLKMARKYKKEEFEVW